MSKLKVVVHLSGGLGNQLFQFMSGIGLAEETNRELFVNTNWFSNPLMRYRNNPAYLIKRRLDILEFTSVAAMKRERFSTPRDGRFERVVSQFTEPMKRIVGIASEASFQKGQWVQPDKIGRLVGHFMSPKFFLNSSTRGRFQDLVHPLSTWTNQMSKAISTRPSIGVHIRLGDYVYLGDKVIPSEAYFLTGINYLKSVLGSDTDVFLFTDEPTLVKERFPRVVNEANIISPALSITPVENLILLSRCSSFVCSNSTFSWWGAHLGDTPKPLIVRPSYFYTAKPELDSHSDLWSVESRKMHPLSGKHG